ncbi:hypothetical protein B0I35DRAFT_431062 [Stachybotrys elegans]|uniref:Uncharacterized protein n=1 Tax=Stachybotrys elegans TaxID=80388 RepID=A0A8K0WTF4_9HYPO|nr:hypothetical protein B0I35DRAFT_431062 [Stachybotrys elegans]
MASCSRSRAVIGRWRRRAPGPSRQSGHLGTRGHPGHIISLACHEGGIELSQISQLIDGNTVYCYVPL